MANFHESQTIMMDPSEPETGQKTPESLAVLRGSRGCGPLILDFRTLAQNRSELFIRLDGETYRLQLTRNNKLILTK